jgi:hypothetical protein
VDIVTWPERLLSQNSELRKDNIFNWSLPAHIIRLTSGELFNTCPNAGSCARVCYAKFGTYRFSNVLARHTLNLEYTMQEPDQWRDQMIREISHKRFNPKQEPRVIQGLSETNNEWLDYWIQTGGAAVRIHDGGDFYSEHYLNLWLDIADAHPHVLFYAYTKEVTMFRKNRERMPDNFRYLYSYGGREDDLIDPDTERHAEVFPTIESLQAAGYHDQGDNDLLAVCAPTTRIGIVANRLPVANKRFAGRTMREMNDR